MAALPPAHAARGRLLGARRSRAAAAVRRDRRDRGRGAAGRAAGRGLGAGVGTGPARLGHPFLRDHRPVPGHGRPRRPVRVGHREAASRRGPQADPGHDPRVGGRGRRPWAPRPSWRAHRRSSPQRSRRDRHLPSRRWRRSRAADAFVSELRRFLEEHGHLGQGFDDLALASWGEEPAMLLAEVGKRLERAVEPATERAARLAGEAETLAEGVRDRLADQPERLAEFERLLGLARKIGPITETHNYWIDRMAQARLRTFVMRVGARLARDGRHRATARRAVPAPGRGAGAPSLARRTVATSSRSGGPSMSTGGPSPRRPRSGSRPTPSPSGRFGGERFAKEDDAIVRGTGASAGIASGPARVVLGPEDFERVRPGRHHRRAVVEPIVGAPVHDRRRARDQHWRRTLPRGGRRPRVRPAGGGRHWRRDDADRRRADARAGRDDRLRSTVVSEEAAAAAEDEAGEPATTPAGGPSRLMTGAMLGLASGAILVPLNSTMLAVALPSVMDEFDVGAATVASLVTLYLGAVAIALPASGSLGDRFGHRRLFLLGVAAFALASALAATATSFEVLALARVFQAVSGAFVSTSSVALLRSMAPPDRRGSAFGLFDMLVSTSAAVGPFIGGLLVAGLGWRSLFVVAVPVAIFAAVAVGAVVRPRPVGAATAATGRAAPDRPARPGRPRGVPRLAACSAFAGWRAAGRRSRRSSRRRPPRSCSSSSSYERSTPPSIRGSSPRARSRRRWSASSATTVILHATLVLVPLLVERLQGGDAQTSGFVLLGISALGAIAAPIGGRRSDVVGRRQPAVIGTVAERRGARRALAGRTGVVHAGARPPAGPRRVRDGDGGLAAADGGARDDRVRSGSGWRREPISPGDTSAGRSAPRWRARCWAERSPRPASRPGSASWRSSPSAWPHRRCSCPDAGPGRRSRKEPRHG